MQILPVGGVQLLGSFGSNRFLSQLSKATAMGRDKKTALRRPRAAAGGPSCPVHLPPVLTLGRVLRVTTAPSQQLPLSLSSPLGAKMDRPCDNLRLSSFSKPCPSLPWLSPLVPRQATLELYVFICSPAICAWASPKHFPSALCPLKKNMD